MQTPELAIQTADSEQALEDWMHVHNVIVPAAAMSLDEVRDRAQRNHLEVAYWRDTLVACTTVRPPVDGDAVATIIVRVLAEHRRRGFGNQLYRRALAHAHTLGAEHIETIVWESNVDGLRFAVAKGFVAVSRYLPTDEEVAYVTLRLGSMSPG